MANKYLCIHGHFYQPPRENPWLDAIEYQESASPYHDWNERVTSECYGPNTRARVHGDKGLILKLVNNYEYMSFNFGATLFSWLKKTHPWIYNEILTADRKSIARYNGHGNAIAQVYNHIIMPLANRRDRLTQIRWGLADFEDRFGRQAEGMWLAETAVDTETLDLMAIEGVKFTILSPTQARMVRSMDAGKKKKSWQDVSGERIDPTRPYRVVLDRSKNRFIDVFFYDGPLSRAVAYEKMLSSGEKFLGRIEQAFGEHHYGPKLVNVATDGESYGHHFKFGDLALSWLFQRLDENGGIRLTNYGAFLESFPPEYEVKIIENSSWSCAHGVERWRSDCGCSINQNPDWNQAWRTPLREGLNRLACELAAIFEENGARFLKSPWDVRDDYIKVMLHPTATERDSFLERNAVRRLNEKEKLKVFQLLESQRMALFMFTSCGWFFDDISGLEAVQVLRYAFRAIDLIGKWAGKDLEAGLMDYLKEAKSNIPDYGDGARIYKRMVKPSRIGASRAAAQYVLSLMVEDAPLDCLFSGMVRPVHLFNMVGDNMHAILGEVKIIETGIGREFKRVFAGLRTNEKEMHCLVAKNIHDIDLKNLTGVEHPALTAESWKRIEESFRQHCQSVKMYGFKDLLPDTRKCLVQGLGSIINRSFKDSIRKHDEAVNDLILLIRETGEQIPEALQGILHLIIADRLGMLLSSKREEQIIDWSSVRCLTGRAGDIIIDDPFIRQQSHDFVRSRMENLALFPGEVPVKNIINFLDLAEELKIGLDLWECQNMFYDLYLRSDYMKQPGQERYAWFHQLGRRLGFLLNKDA